MLNRFTGAVASAILMLAPAAFAQGTAAQAPNNTWTIAPLDSSANFTVKHLLISTEHGGMGGMKGTVIYDPKDPSKDSVEATLDVSTINTNNPTRDEKLKTEYFDVKQFPLITFKSTKVFKAGTGRLRMIGNLTIKGTTKQVVLEVQGPSAAVKDAQGRQKVALTATAKVSRKDFGITGDALDSALETGGIIVSDEVSIELDIELMLPSQAGIVGPAKPK
jgi:polyisoprenoid-binding protein YceI